MPLGQHLGADQQAGAAGPDALQLFIHCAPARHAVAVESPDRHRRKSLRQPLLELLRPFACTHQCVRAAVRTQGRGPALAGIFGREVLLSTGDTVVADEAYVRESIVNPAARVVAGYQPVMPTYQGQLKDAEIEAIIEYIKTLK